MSLLVVGLDATVVTVALPAIRTSLHGTISELQWIVDSYSLVLASLLVLAGSTADRFGRRLVLQVGMSVFMLGSLLCALTPSVECLIAFRALQALGGAMLNPVAMSIVRNVFEDPRERAGAIGVFASMFGVSMALGPVLGGLLVSTFSWRAIFLINLPVCAAALVLAARFVPESRADHPRRFDVLGQVLVMTVLASLTAAIIEGGAQGFGHPAIIGLFAFAASGTAALISYEGRRDQPLLEMQMFRNAGFSGAIAVALLLSTALGGFLFTCPLYLQSARGLSPLSAGLYVLPAAVMIVVFAPISGRLLGRVGPRLSTVAGGVAVAVSGLMLTQLAAVDSSRPLLLAAYATFGFGFAFASPAIANTVVSAMPAAQAGVAAAMATSSRQTGITLGTAVFGALLAAANTRSSATTLAGATRPAWAIIGALGLAVATVGFAMSTTRPESTGALPNAA